MYKLITQLQGLKTSIIDLAAIVYAIGLISWSINAYKNSLGLISAFNTQYLTAGIVPCLIFIVGFYFVFYNASWITNSIKRRIIKDRKLKRDNPTEYYKNRKDVWRITLFASAANIFACTVVIVGEFNWYAALMIFLSAFTMISSIFLLRWIVKSERKEFMSFKRARSLYNWLVRDRASLVYFKFLTVIYALLATYFYANWIYPSIPQELGGAKPKKCVLECKKGTFSAGTSLYLFRDTTREIMESKPVYVYYYNEDQMIIKLDEYDSHCSVINRRDVAMIRWIR